MTLSDNYHRPSLIARPSFNLSHSTTTI